MMMSEYLMNNLRYLAYLFRDIGEHPDFLVLVFEVIGNHIINVSFLQNMDAFLIDLLISQHSVNNSEAFDVYRPIIYVHYVPLKNNLQSFF